MLKKMGSSLSPKPIVVSGPSGCGKSTLMKRLFAEFPNIFGFSVSHTTRKPRPGETDGIEYHFVSKESFQKAVVDGYFIEHALFSNNYYGTSFKAVQDVTASGKVCMLDIDMQGVKAVKASHLQARYIFLQPPSMAELERRLRGRGTETEDSIKARLEAADKELQFSKTASPEDKVLVNEDIDRAYLDFKSFIFQDPAVAALKVTDI